MPSVSCGDGPLVRASVEGDMNVVADIYRHHVETGLGSFEEEAPGVAELTRRRDAFVRRGLPYLVAELDGVVCGFAYAAPYRTRAAYRFTVEDSIYVADGSTRRGVGRALLSRLIEDCTALGHRQMIAVIGDTGNAASITLHEQMGFCRAGTLRAVGYKFERWVDCVLMQRPLGSGADDAPRQRTA